MMPPPSALLVVPARPLRRLSPVALEHPVAELAAHREDAAEESGIAQHLELAQARQGQLVLDDAVLCLARLRQLGHGDGLLEAVGDRLFAIDVLARLDRLRQQLGAHLRRRRIEEQRVVGIFQRRGEIGGRSLDAVFARERSDLLGVATDQDRVGHDAIAVRQRHAPLLADGNDRSHQVLIEPHAPGDAVHDDAEAVKSHWSPAFLHMRAGGSRRALSNWMVTNAPLRAASVKRVLRSGMAAYPPSFISGTRPLSVGGMSARPRRYGVRVPPGSPAHPCCD